MQSQNNETIKQSFKYQLLWIFEPEFVKRKKKIPVLALIELNITIKRGETAPLSIYFIFCQRRATGDNNAAFDIKFRKPPACNLKESAFVGLIQPQAGLRMQPRSIYPPSIWTTSVKGKQRASFPSLGTPLSFLMKLAVQTCVNVISGRRGLRVWATCQ